MSQGLGDVAVYSFPIGPGGFIFIGGRYFQEHDGFGAFLHNQGAMLETRRDGDDSRAGDNIFFQFVAQADADFRPEIVDIRGVSPEEAKQFVIVMRMRLVGRIARLGNAVVT